MFVSEIKLHVKGALNNGVKEIKAKGGKLNQTYPMPRMGLERLHPIG
jgi:hypothetical protein